MTDAQWIYLRELFHEAVIALCDYDEKITHSTK